MSVANDVNLSEGTLNAISECFASSLGDSNFDGYELVSRDVVPLSVSAPANPTTLKGWLLKLIGDYENIFTVETYSRVSGNTSSLQYVTDMSPDYPWVYSCLLFIVVMFSIFKLIGGYVCKL